jgi:hypothetical protein
MPGSYTDYLESAVLGHVFCGTTYTAPATKYLGLFTVSPTDAGGGTELTGGGYSRVSVSFSLSAGAAVNSADNTFPNATVDWGTVVSVGVFDAATGGNLMAWADIATARTVLAGDSFRVPAGALSITQT